MLPTASASLIIAALALVAVPTLAAGETDLDLPASELELTGARLVEVPDTRIVTMSPDGRSIAVVVERPEPAATELCVLELATLEAVACADLTDLEAGLRIDDVTWSPDGRFLAFTERVFETFTDGDLWLMDTASGELTNLLDDGFEGLLPLMQRDASEGTVTIPTNPAFTPDGTALAFSRSLIVDGEMAGNDVVTLSLDGGDPEQLWSIDPFVIGVASMGMAWAPDGERLYISVSDPSGRGERDGVWIVDAAGGEPRHLIGRQPGGTSALAVLQVAADGRHVLAYDPAMYGRETSGPPALALVDAETGALTPLLSASDGGGPVQPASWARLSPDGGVLATLLASTDAGALVLRDAGGAEEHALTLPPELARRAAAGPASHRSAGTWSQNGRLLLALAGDPAAALVLDVSGAGSAEMTAGG